MLEEGKRGNGRGQSCAGQFSVLGEGRESLEERKKFQKCGIQEELSPVGDPGSTLRAHRRESRLLGAVK